MKISENNRRCDNSKSHGIGRNTGFGAHIA